jgi:hypothetical protein
MGLKWNGQNDNLGSVYAYLFASYSGLGAEVWNIGDLHGLTCAASLNGRFLAPPV